MSLRYPAKDPAQQVNGDVTITAHATQTLSRFDLDFAGDGVGSVTVNGHAATFTRAGEELVITPARPITDHSAFTVTVCRFTATPKTPDPNDLVSSGFLAVKDATVLSGQPSFTHQLFPSNDHPRDKATYAITLTVPHGWAGIANGVLTSSEQVGGSVTSTYRESNPMATELVQVAVGDFVVRRQGEAAGVPIRDVFSRSLAASGLPNLTDEGNEILWMQKKAGKYPFENYGSLVVDTPFDFALETQTLPIYGTTILGHPDGRDNPVLIHELAHQWYGDSVSPYSWSDVWQNEGQATYYELKYAEETGVGPDYYRQPTVEDYYHVLYKDSDEWRAEFGPVAMPKSAATVLDLFNDNVYYGGALTLDALRLKVGDATFAAIEKAWPALYLGQSASTEDFIQLASKVAGQDLTSFLDAWLYGTKTPPMPGHPDWTSNPVSAGAAQLKSSIK